jgi:phage RecT family recombinase
MAQQKQKSQAVATRPPTQVGAPIKELAGFLEGRKGEIAKILPQGLSVERVVKTAIMAAMEHPDIGEKCTPVSIYRSIVQASLMGLTVGTGFNEGYLIRYGNSCTFRASYLGWVKVARRSDGVDMIRASVVYEHDEFTLSEQPPDLKHKPRWKNGSRGGVIGSAAVAYTLRNGKHELHDFTFVTAEELAKAKEIADRGKPSPSWRAWPDEMRKKVAIRRLCKMLPKNEELNRLTRIENNADNGVVDVPDPDIDNLEEIYDQRFDPPEEAPAENKPPAAATKNEDLPEPEVVKEEKPPAKQRNARTDKLKGKMKTAKEKPKEEPEPEPTPPPPDDADAPDYGGPDDQEF